MGIDVNILLSVLATVVSLSVAKASTVNDLDVVTALNGRMSKCSTEADLNSSGWILKNTEVVPAPQLSVVIAGDAVYYACTQDATGKVAWTEGRVHEPILRTSFDGTRYTLWTDRNEFLVTNRQLIILSSDPAGTSPIVSINHVYSLESIMTPEEMKSLEAGEPVRVILSAFPRGISFYQIAGQDPVPLGQWTGGAYAIRFTVQLVNGALRVIKI